jgi:hypothetical protein
MSTIANAIDVMALLLAMLVLGRMGMRTPLRALAGFASLALAITGVLFAAPMSVPEWTRVVAIVAMVAGFYALIAAFDSIGGAPGGGDDDHGHGPDPPTGRDGGPGSLEPQWWPEFERQFASYVARRSASRRWRDLSRVSQSRR